MKQLMQSLKDGKLQLLESPLPRPGANSVLVQSKFSLISIGTERMLHKFGSSNYLSKIKQQPDKVKLVIDKIKTDGLFTVYEMVKNKLDEPIPLGYSNVGVVKELGKNIDEFQIGDRVVSASPHAEYVRALKNLTAKIPEKVSDEEAAFAVPGSISLNAVRLMNVELGGTYIVVGLGLLGQLAVQIIEANGGNAIGFDLDSEKVQLANQLGYTALDNFEMLIEKILEVTHHHGADGVLISASADDQNLINSFSELCRKRGAVVLLGVAPININRDIFYKKELSFTVSSAYGPGRYDPLYENHGFDYPIAYVRWTAKRNIESFLNLLQKGKINVKPLISKVIPFDHILEKYPEVLNDKQIIGALIQYKSEVNESKVVTSSSPVNAEEDIRIGFIGSGNFSKMILLPILQKNHFKIQSIYSSDGISAAMLAKKFDIPEITSEVSAIIKNKNVNTVFVASRHNTHFTYVKEALNEGKHVFVEKPLVINWDEFYELSNVLKNKKSLLMVGFNRRFAPLTEKLKNRLKNRNEPIAVNIMVNAGWIDPTHWVHDPETGGTRIIGEVCHFIDLARYLVGFPIEFISAMSFKNHPEINYDKVSVSMNFEDGSIATVHYWANGSKKFPKERVEVFYQNKIFQIDNFKKLASFGDKLKSNLRKQDKGHEKEIVTFLEHVQQGKEEPIPIEEILEIHAATMAINDVNNHFKMINVKELLTRT